MIKQLEKKKQRQTVAVAMKVRGYLLKKSASILSNYQRRFFIIIDNHFAYFADETLDEPKKQLNLDEIKYLKAINTLEFSFYYKNKEYLFKAISTKQRDQWVFSLTTILQFINQIKAQNSSKLLVQKGISLETKFGLNMKKVFASLYLQLLQRDYHEDYIRSRVAGHMCSKGCLFLVSIKSLSDEMKDQIILDKQFIDPYDFNILYLYDQKANTRTKVFLSEQMAQIVLTARTLRINTSFFNLVQQQQPSVTLQFINRLKKSIAIGQQYRNKEGIQLKQNVDYLVSLFDKREDRLYKQHIQVKFQDEYIEMILMFKGYKKIYSKFHALIKHIVFSMSTTLNAFKLKNTNLYQLQLLYITFYAQKTYKLMKNYWAQNHQIMATSQIISISSLSNAIYDIVIHYIKDGSQFMYGMKLLRDIYIKKLLVQIEVQLKDFLKDQSLFSQLKNNVQTIIPYHFIKIVQQKCNIIQKFTISKQLAYESQRLLLQASVLILIAQINIKIILYKYNKQLLIYQSRDAWSYYDLMKQRFKGIDLKGVDDLITKFHKQIIKKIFKHHLLQHQKYLKMADKQFLQIDIEYYVNISKDILNEIKNIDPRSYNEFQTRNAECFNNYYFRSIVNFCSKIFISEGIVSQILNKVQKDLLIVMKVFEVPYSSKVEKLIRCVYRIIAQQTTETNIKQRHSELKFELSIEDFRLKDIRFLLQIRHSSNVLQQHISFLHNYEDIIQKQQVQDIVEQLNEGISLKTVRSRKQTYERTEAEILIKADIDFQGYLKRKRIQANNTSGGYLTEYCKLNSQCLLWYDNPKSFTLVGRIFLSEIKQVYLHPKAPQKFFIDLKVGIKHKFKATSQQISLRWVQQINNSLIQPKSMSQLDIKPQFQQQLFFNYFQVPKTNINNKNRQSILSNFRNIQSSKATTHDQSHSQSPEISKKQIKPKKKKFGLGKLLGCISLE